MSEKFTELNSSIYAYLVQQRSGSQDLLLESLRKETAQLGTVSAMQISREQGSFFTLLVSALNIQNAIEIGTFTGYSSICIARGLGAHGKLLCCDVDEEWTKTAIRYWKQARLQDKIQLQLGPAADTLKQLPSDLVFDFAFIDADKEGYNTYFEILIPKMRKNGLMIFDNMLWGGRLSQDQDIQHPSGKAIHEMNRKLSVDPRVESVLLPIADGLMLCRKK